MGIVKKGFRKHIVIAFIFALLANAVSPFAASFKINKTSQVSDILGKKILICTPSGYRWVSVAENESDIPDQEGGKFHCPLCYISQSNLKFTNHLVLPDFVRAGNSYFFTNLLDEQKQQISFHFYSSRAPPLVG